MSPNSYVFQASVPLPDLVSIVLPTHNGRRYLREAIESCLAQDDPRLELILVDDASTDETPSILADFAHRDPRVRVFRHSTNRLLPAALNTGFSQARGSFLTWTSDDNLYRPNALSAMRAALLSNDGMDVVYANCAAIDSDGNPLRPMRMSEPANLMRFNCIGACFLFRRHVYETLGGYDEALFLVEDYDFWLRAYPHFRFQHLAEELYAYRQHPDSLTALGQAQVHKVMIRVLDGFLQKNRGVLRRADYAQGYLTLARITATERRWRDFLRCTANALATDPSLPGRRCWRVLLRKFSPSKCM